MGDPNRGHTSRLFTVLSHRYRRIVLYYLREHETASVDDLADLVTGSVESGAGPDAAVDRDTVRLELHHVHLPSLDSSSLVSYDQRSGQVALADVTESAAEVIDAAREADTTDQGLDLQRVFSAIDDGE